MWAGADPRSKGPSLHEWSDETDTDSFTTAIEEVCSKGRLDILKRLRVDPTKDNLQEALKCAAWSCGAQLVEYLLELGVDPNDKPTGGSRALDQCIQRFGYATWRDGPTLRIWELTSEFNCLRQLVKHKARWVPNEDTYYIKDLRRNLLKCDPDVTAELIKILISNDACSVDTIRRLLFTPRMKSHMEKLEEQLRRMGIVGTKGADDHKSDNSQKESRISERLLRKYSREMLYAEVWEQPIKILCSKYGISDVALAKVCKKLNVPLPGRGYWAKKSAGLKVKTRPELPPYPSRSQA